MAFISIRGSDMSETIKFDSYNDSTQAQYTKAWINHHAAQKENFIKNSLKEASCIGTGDQTNGDNKITETEYPNKLTKRPEHLPRPIDLRV
jgi:hypothetical protein